jgi:lipooligosaccharide transport system ATP-binding protein
MSIIRVKGLTKKFKELTAVDNIDLEINQGECFGLLGPNGAGKTTLIRMITGISPPTAGEVWVLDYNLKTHARQAKAKLGIVPQNDNLDPDLKTQQNLITFARYFDIPSRVAKERSLEILKFFELEGKRNSWIDELSGGMKRRLLIARALINEPSIVVLDEPTSGLDPHAKYLLWDRLTDLKARGITQILCTQNMEEASHLCDRVAIMDQGKILSLDAPDNLVNKYAGRDVLELWLKNEDRNKILAGLKSRNLEYREISGKIDVFYVDDENYIKSLLNYPGRLNHRPANLEDVFLKLTGRSLEE